MRKLQFVLMLATIAVLVGSCGSTETDSTVETGKTAATTEEINSKTTDASETHETIEVNLEEVSEDAETDIVISIESILKGLGEGPAESNLQFWSDIGIEVEENNRVMFLCNSLKFYYPSGGLYVFAEGMLDEEELVEAAVDRGDLEKWFENCSTVILPKKFTGKDTQYFSYFQTQEGFAEKGDDLTSLLDSDNEKTSSIINNMMDAYGVDDCSFIYFNGIRYASCYGQTERGLGAAYMTILDGDLFLFYFDSFISPENMNEVFGFINCIMNSFYPIPVKVMEIDEAKGAGLGEAEEAVEYWAYMKQEAPEPNSRAILAGALELRYPDDQINVAISGNVDQEEAEAAGTDYANLEGYMVSHSADALVWPKARLLTDNGYTCHIRIIPKYFEYGEELSDLRNAGSKRLLELLEEYDLTEFYEYNGIEYATGIIDTMKDGLVLLDLTVADGNLITLAYSFDSEYFKELPVFRRYILSSIFRLEDNETSRDYKK